MNDIVVGTDLSCTFHFLVNDVIATSVSISLNGRVRVSFDYNLLSTLLRLDDNLRLAPHVKNDAPLPWRCPKRT